MSSINYTLARTLTVTDVTSIPTPPAPWYGYDCAVRDAAGGNASSIEPAYSGEMDRQPNTIILWETGCRHEQAWNCTAVCYNEIEAPSVWNSTGGMWTLQNCLVYPLLAATAGIGKLVEEPPGTLEKYGIMQNSSWAEAIVNETTAMDLFPIVAGCLQQAAAAQDSSASLDWQPFGYPSWSNETMSAVYPARNIDVGGLVNQDVGGPGVATSLLVQSCILLAAWLFIDLNTGWLQTLGQFLRLIPNKIDTGWRVLRFPTQRAAVITALVDFQKTQVFFSLTLQFALLISYSNNALLQAESWEQLRLNFEEVPILAAPGAVAVVLNIIILRKDTEELEWYVLGISSICVVVSAITAFLATSIIPSPDQPQDQEFEIQICGFFSPYYTSSSGPPTPRHIEGIFAPNIIMPIPILAMIFILIEKLYRTPFLESKLELGRRTKFLHQCMPSWAQAASAAIRNLCWFSIEIWLLYSSVAIGVREFHDATTVDDVEWSLGQIIAVAIWVPVFVNWSYTALAGIEKAFKHVLSRDYRVIKKDLTVGNVHIVEHDQSAGGDDIRESLLIQSAASGHELQAPGHRSGPPRRRLQPANTM